MGECVSLVYGVGENNMGARDWLWQCHKPIKNRYSKWPLQDIISSNIIKSEKYLFIQWLWSNLHGNVCFNTLPAGKFFMLFCCQNQLFRKILSGTTSECQTDWIHIRPNTLSGLIWVQTVCKSYQKKTLGDKELKKVYHLKGSVGLHCISYTIFTWPQLLTGKLNNECRTSDFFQDLWAKWPMEQKMVGHFLKWWAQAYQTNHSWHLGCILYLHTDTEWLSDTCMHICILTADYTVKPVLSVHSKKKTNYRLMQVKSIAECCNTFDLH